MDSLRYFTAQLQPFLDDLRQLVELETPTGDTERAAIAAGWLSDRFAPYGDVTSTELEGYGPLLTVRRPGTSTRVLLLAHYDTVHPVGSWDRTWEMKGGRAWGPGVYDMKAGLLFILWLLRWLDREPVDHPELYVVLNPEEEVGSPQSAATIREAACQCHFALVLEPCSTDGSLKLARKASGEYQVHIRGRAAHQGVDPERGANAVVEAARQILAICRLDNPEAGTTVAPNVVAGGSMSNVVADHAEILVDVRTWVATEMQRVHNAIATMRAGVPGCEVRVTGQWNRPPMQETPASRELFERSRSHAERLGFSVGWTRWGGSSDANLTAHYGAATMDGLGPSGDGAHREDEHVLLASIPQRLALLAELVGSLAAPPDSWMSAAGLASLGLGEES